MSTKPPEQATPRLEPCPFCGNRPWSGAVPADDHLGPDWWSVGCGDCEVKIERPDEAMALRDWNDRPSLWQPIETAPKGGTLILLLSEGGYVTPGCWDCDSADEGGQCWRDRVYDADRITPTLWMPLPAAPALTEQTEAQK